MIKPKFQKLYMDWAKRTAELSYARRLQVGAVIVKDDTVISYGYNGMPAGWNNNCEDKVLKVVGVAPDGHDIVELELKTKPEVLHAEMNALGKLAKNHNSGLDASIFITHAPCIECSKLIFTSGIRTVYFGEQYRDDSGIKFLKNSGVEVVYLE